MIVPGFATGQSSEQDIETVFSRRPGSSRGKAIFVRATEEFKKVLALDPSLVEAEVNLGLAYQSLLDYDAGGPLSG